MQPAVSWEELQALAALPPKELRTLETYERLGDEVARCEVLISGSRYRQLLSLRLFDAADPSGYWRSTEEFLMTRLGWNYKTANERVRVARSLGRLPLIDAAFRDGLLSYTKVRAIHDVATPDNEAYLLETARGATGSQLQRLVAPMRAALRRAQRGPECHDEARGVRFAPHAWLDLTQVEATLHPEEGATVRKALEVAVELGVRSRRENPPGESAAADVVRARFGFADGLVLIAEHFLAHPPEQGVPAARRELVVHTVPDLSQGVLETGGSLSAEAMRRLACDGPLVEVERGEGGEILDVGRRTRRISRRLERALLIRDRCCRFPGCTRRLLLDAHHLQHWADGGATKLSNLVRLCRTHHRLVHEYGWSLRSEDGRLVPYDRHGREVEVPGQLPTLLDAETALASLETDSKEQGLEPDVEAFASQWHGERIENYADAHYGNMQWWGFDDYGEEGHPPAIRWLLEHPPGAPPDRAPAPASPAPG